MHKFRKKYAPSKIILSERYKNCSMGGQLFAQCGAGAVGTRPALPPTAFPNLISATEIEQKLPRSPAKRFTSMCYTVIGVALSLTRPHKLFRKGSFLRNITRRKKLWHPLSVCLGSFAPAGVPWRRPPPASAAHGAANED